MEKEEMRDYSDSKYDEWSGIINNNRI